MNFVTSAFGSCTFFFILHMLKKKNGVHMKTVLISCLTHDAGRYIQALKQAGVTPVLSDQIEDENLYDGLLLPGGGDISPIFYHRKNRGSKDICITEDIIQLLLFHRFLEQKKPILGICKGMQLINVALGGSLIQDLPTNKIHAYDNGDRYHNTKALSGSLLHSLYGKDCITNSAHHQAVNRLGSDLSISQYSYDGIAEAIEHKQFPILGIQWHPERLLASDLFPKNTDNSLIPKDHADGQKIFSYFADLL